MKLRCVCLLALVVFVNAAVGALRLAAKQPSSDALATALNLVNDISTKQHSVKGTASPPANASHQQQRAKLDVGFADFNKQLMVTLNTELGNATGGHAWTNEMRQQLAANVTERLKAGITKVLAPIKASIGKTWMALPQDDQKNELVTQLKNGFVSVFANSLQTFDSHFKLGLKRVKIMAERKHPAIDSASLLAKSEDMIIESVLAEHCYDDSAGAKGKAPPKANATTPNHAKFCIKSVAGNLAHRLNDTQSLFSMSMRFEAGAMSLAQRAAAKPEH